MIMPDLRYKTSRFTDVILTFCRYNAREKNFMSMLSSKPLAKIIQLLPRQLMINEGAWLLAQLECPKPYI